jgi:hypothetical protein
VVRREAVINLTEDLNVEVCQEAVTRKICIVRVVFNSFDMISGDGEGAARQVQRHGQDIRVGLNR